MKRDAKRDGFTLMEVALAVVVVGVGILGMFALISGGLDSSAKAAGITQSAFFAEATLNAIRVSSSTAAQKSDLAWTNFWRDFTTTETPTNMLTVPAPSAWVDGDNAAMMVTGKDCGPNKARLLQFQNTQVRGVDDENTPVTIGRTSTNRVSNGRLRYRITVARGPATGRDVRRVILRVWPGNGIASGDGLTAVDDRDAIVFYSEYANVGSL
jgi:uncharacterized protein (TIGR02598 family)